MRIEVKQQTDRSVAMGRLQDLLSNTVASLDRHQSRLFLLTQLLEAAKTNPSMLVPYGICIPEIEQAIAFNQEMVRKGGRNHETYNQAVHDKQKRYDYRDRQERVLRGIRSWRAFKEF